MQDDYLSDAEFDKEIEELEKRRDEQNHQPHTEQCKPRPQHSRRFLLPHAERA